MGIISISQAQAFAVFAQAFFEKACDQAFFEKVCPEKGFLVVKEKAFFFTPAFLK